MQKAKRISAVCPALLDQLRELHKLERLAGSTSIKLPVSRMQAEDRLKVLRELLKK